MTIGEKFLFLMGYLYPVLWKSNVALDFCMLFQQRISRFLPKASKSWICPSVEMPQVRLLNFRLMMDHISRYWIHSFSRSRNVWPARAIKVSKRTLIINWFLSCHISRQAVLQSTKSLSAMLTSKGTWEKGLLEFWKLFAAVICNWCRAACTEGEWQLDRKRVASCFSFIAALLSWVALCNHHRSKFTMGGKKRKTDLS